MYSINMNEIGEKIRRFRILNSLSLEQLSSRVFKTKATLSKYEKGQIVPDIITLTEICNALNIDINQVLQIEKIADKPTFFSDNTKLYLYYYTQQKLITSHIYIGKNNNATLYNDITNAKSKYQYTGVIKHDSSNCYIELSNNIKLEEVYISFNKSWDNLNSPTPCFILGITPNFTPVNKKGILCAHEITNDETLNKLKISREEVKEILKNNCWNLG